MEKIQDEVKNTNMIKTENCARDLKVTRRKRNLYDMWKQANNTS